VAVVVAEDDRLVLRPAHVVEIGLHSLDHMVARLRVTAIPAEREMLDRVLDRLTARSDARCQLELIGSAIGPQHLVDRRSDVVVGEIERVGPFDAMGGRGPVGVVCQIAPRPLKDLPADKSLMITANALVNDLPYLPQQWLQRRWCGSA